jgi:hypothetical protein
VNVNVVKVAGAAALLSALLAGGSVSAGQQLPLEPNRDSGQGVTAAYEGWFRNADGTFTLLVGYFNRNQKQALDIPIGAANQIEPGGPDRGQPTHFLPHRQWGVFTIVVPADFANNKLTWTLTANGKTSSVPMGLHRDYEVEPFKDAALGNTPPRLRFAPGGPALEGPPRGIATVLEARVGDPLTLTVWVQDDAVVDPRRPAGADPLKVSWSRSRGPADVSFSNIKPPVAKGDGKATTTATFGAPGEYVLRVQANDVSGDGGQGFQCCWTNALVSVVVK